MKACTTIKDYGLLSSVFLAIRRFYNKQFRVKDMNAKVFNLISRVYETRF